MGERYWASSENFEMEPAKKKCDLGEKKKKGRKEKNYEL